jgi:guanylate kinase
MTRRPSGAVDEYEYVVINRQLDRCVADLCAIVTAERARRKRRQPEVAPIVKTFHERE